MDARLESSAEAVTRMRDCLNDLVGIMLLSAHWTGGDITSAGNVKHLHAVGHVMEEIAGRPVFIGAIQDVTAGKVAEQALNRARSELAHVARVTTLRGRSLRCR